MTAYLSVASATRQLNFQVFVRKIVLIKKPLQRSHTCLVGLDNLRQLPPVVWLLWSDL